MIRRGNNTLYIYLFLFVFICLTTSVVAQEGLSSTLNSVSGVLSTFFEFASPLLNVLFGDDIGDEGEGAYYLVRILLFIIILSVVWSTVTRIELFNSRVQIEWVVTIAVTILATRWLSGIDGLVETVLLPYNVLGVSLSAFLPLIIYFYFLEVGLKGRRNRSLRSIGWVFLMVVFIFLWITRAANEDLGVVTSGLLIYPITAGLCILFIVMDPQIQRLAVKNKVDRIIIGADKRRIRALERDLKDIEELLLHENDRNRILELERDREEIRKQLIKLRAGA